MLVGMGTSNLTLPIGAAQSREVDLLMVFRYAGTYPAALEMLAKDDPNGPNVAKLITHVYEGLDEAAKAFTMAGKTKDDSTGKLVLKVVIRERALAESMSSFDMTGAMFSWT